MFCFEAHRLPCGCLTEPLSKSRIHEMAWDGYVLQERTHLSHFPQPAQAHCGVSQGSLESGESTKLWTGSTPQRRCVAPLLELLLKVPGRVTTGRHSHRDWSTSFPLTKLVCWAESAFCASVGPFMYHLQNSGSTVSRKVAKLEPAKIKCISEKFSHNRI